MNTGVNKANAGALIAAVVAYLAGLAGDLGHPVPAEAQAGMVALIGWLAIYFMPNKA